MSTNGLLSQVIESKKIIKKGKLQEGSHKIGKYTINILSDKDFNKVPIEHMDKPDTLGATDVKNNTLYVRNTKGLGNFSNQINIGTLEHEIEEMVSKVSNHEEDGIRYKKWGRTLATVGGAALGTILLPGLGTAWGASLGAGIGAGTYGGVRAMQGKQTHGSAIKQSLLAGLGGYAGGAAFGGAGGGASGGATGNTLSSGMQAAYQGASTSGSLAGSLSGGGSGTLLGSGISQAAGSGLAGSLGAAGGASAGALAGSSLLGGASSNFATGLGSSFSGIPAAGASYHPNSLIGSQGTSSVSTPGGGSQSFFTGIKNSAMDLGKSFFSSGKGAGAGGGSGNMLTKFLSNPMVQMGGLNAISGMATQTQRPDLGPTISKWLSQESVTRAGAKAREMGEENYGGEFESSNETRAYAGVLEKDIRKNYKQRRTDLDKIQARSSDNWMNSGERLEMMEKLGTEEETEVNRVTSDLIYRDKQVHAQNQYNWITEQARMDEATKQQYLYGDLEDILGRYQEKREDILNFRQIAAQAGLYQQLGAMGAFAR